MESEKLTQENKKKTQENENTNKQTDLDEDTKDNLDTDQKSSKFLKRGRIFIRNLPFSVTEEKIRILFAKFGEIKELNLPYDNVKKMFRGFCFLQYETKKEALVAIKELNGKTMDRRKLDITIAQPKNEYSGLPKIEKESVNFNRNRNISKNDGNAAEDQSKSRNLSANSVEAKTIEKHTRNAARSGNDPSRTLFIRNLGFNTTEDLLQNLFSKYGKLRYCLICRNKETNSSKGSGFVMFESAEDMDNVLRIYEKYESNKDYSGLNPFELEGRNLKIFRSVSKDEAVKTKEAKKTEDQGDNRFRELLYYGLNNYYDFAEGKEADVSEEDKQKRENIIQQKKMNFKKNPNLHVSETRLNMRNFDKAYDEAKIKELLRQKTEQFMDELKSTKSADYKVYMKMKKIKQIKLMRDEKVLDKDNKAKSKSVAFVEVCDKNFGKWLIKSLSNCKVSKNPKKGLIMDFVLDDIRKIRNRLIKLDRLKMKKKVGEAEDGKSRSKSKSKKEKSHAKGHEGDLELNEESVEIKEKKANVESIDTITDVSKLAEIYQKTVSRGKRQRIKKRVIALGHSVSVLGKSKELNFSQIDKKIVQNKNNFFIKSEDQEINNGESRSNTEKIEAQKEFLKNLSKGISTKNAETYTVVRVDNENMNINKKIKDEIKKGKSKNKNEYSENLILNEKKRGRGRESDSSTSKKHKHKFDKKSNSSNKNENGKKDFNNSKNKGDENRRGKEKATKKDIYADDDDDMGGFEMSHYINKIEENLRNNK